MNEYCPMMELEGQCSRKEVPMNMVQVKTPSIV
jgi:hypothetical protein